MKIRYRIVMVSRRLKVQVSIAEDPCLWDLAGLFLVKCI